MVPDLHVFLDVDDLEEIGDLEGYIERTSIICVYCSNGYFTSKNCMRELVSASLMGKPIISLVDLDQVCDCAEACAEEGAGPGLPASWFAWECFP